MTISELISKLKVAQEKHGDLPIFTTDADIHRIKIHACKDGGMSWTNGVPDHEPNELILEFCPK